MARRAVPLDRHRRLDARRHRPRREGQPPGRGRGREADLVLFVVDATRRAAPTTTRRSPTGCARPAAQVLVVANKADNDRREDDRWEFLALGLGEPFPVSALHGRRAGDLLDVVLDRSRRQGRARRAATTATLDGRRRAEPWTPRRSASRRASPSSGARTSARARCSTGSSARTARSSTTWPAPPATRSTRSSRPRTGRSCSSTPPACARARRIDDSAEYYSLVRALRAIDDADIALLVDRRHRGRHRPGPAPRRARRRRRLPDRDHAQQVGADRRPRAPPRGAGRAARASWPSSATRRS